MSNPKILTLTVAATITVNLEDWALDYSLGSNAEAAEDAKGHLPEVLKDNLTDLLERYSARLTGLAVTA